jgi:hypothetical protein
MTIESIMDNLGDQFSIGMCVLAVDDCPIGSFSWRPCFMDANITVCFLFFFSFVFVYQFLDMGFWICALFFRIVF